MTEFNMRHSPSIAKFSPLVKIDWSLHYAFYSSGATTRQTFSFGSALKLVIDLNWDQAIQWSQISLIQNRALWIYSEKNWPTWSSSLYNLELEMSLIYSPYQLLTQTIVRILWVSLQTCDISYLDHDNAIHRMSERSYWSFNFLLRKVYLNIFFEFNIWYPKLLR